MDKVPQRALFLFFIFLFAVHQVLQRAGMHIAFLDHYLDAFLFPIVLMPLLLFEKRILLNNPTFRFSPTLLIVYFIVLTGISEFLFPWLSDRFFYDPWDIVAILFGMGVFHVCFNQKRKNR